MIWGYPYFPKHPHTLWGTLQNERTAFQNDPNSILQTQVVNTLYKHVNPNKVFHYKTLQNADPESGYIPISVVPVTDEYPFMDILG